MYDYNLTELAHSFSKHATRHPSTWGQLRAGFWTVGKGSYSGDWKSMQASNEAFRDAGNRWMGSLTFVL